MISNYSNQFYLERKSDDPTPTATPPPPFRRLRGYAFDPSLSLRLETASINQTVFETPWENNLRPGPRGEYLEVVDYDPASGCWYEPVDLNEVEIVAQDGLAPSEGNPQFHQQMVYAAAMNTIQHFEHALGRQVFWSAVYDKDKPPGERERFVQCLRLYPHALRGANAYYSPAKRAILFGYFPGPSGMVFSCLSHDIVAHEVTHALLDGMHSRFVEDNHPDSLAFHEAFADLVALFQHFTFPEVLKHQIAKTKGDLNSPSLLGELAQQFGEATGRYGALREAIGSKGEDGVWQPLKPDPKRLQTEFEPHARGSILVAALFGAFVAANKRRLEQLIRIATGGTGILPEGAISADLVQRIADETNSTARTFLNMCIRALDYCPPVDMNFGDYLRALITADFDMVPNDRNGYRIALIESFRRWGIMPTGLRTLSEEQLRWPFANMKDREGWNALTDIAEKLKPHISDTLYIQDRARLFEVLRNARRTTHEYLESVMSVPADAPARPEFSRVTGISFDRSLEGIRTNGSGMPVFEVHALRPALRVSPDGTILKQLILVLAQRRAVPVDPANEHAGTFDFRGGATLVFDLAGQNERPSLRYAVVRPIDDNDRLQRIREYWTRKSEDQLSLRNTYFGSKEPAGEKEESEAEPFSLLHSEV